MPDSKENQLEILCEIPLKIKIGEQNFKVHPLTFKRLVELKPHVQTIFEKVGGISQIDFSKGEFVGTIFDNIEALMEDILKAMKLVLVSENGFECTDDFLKEHLDTVKLGTVLGFLVKTSNLGETVKNVAILRGMVR